MRATIFFIATLGLLTSCGPKIYSSQIFNIPQTEEGTIFIQASGLGDSKKLAYEKAIYNAYSTLIFQGIPESIQSRPMVEPQNAEKVRSKVNECLKDNDCYKNFTTQIYQVGETEKVKGGYKAVNQVKINIRALRSYLEQNNIIRKFGY